MATNEPIHPWRWRALTVWVVAFTLLTAYALWSLKHNAARTDKRFCDVTSSFLQAAANLHDQIDKSDVITIGLRKELQRAARNASYVFTLIPQSAINPTIRVAVLNFFQATDDLEQAQIRLGQAALDRADAFVDQLDQLRRRLRCPD